MMPGGTETGLPLMSVATPSTIRSPDLEYIFAARRSGASDPSAISISWWAMTSGFNGL
jgi:hypothetical protein